MPSREHARIRVGAWLRRAAPGLLALLLLACKAVPEGGAGKAEAALFEVRLGGPWSAAAGKEPKATGAFGYAVERGLAQPILAQHGFRFGGFVPFNNGPPVVQAVAAGSVSIGSLGDTPAVSGRAGGIDTRAVLIDKPTGDAWFLARVGGAKTIAELVGKKVGMQFGSNFDKYGRGVLRAAGVLDKVELVNVSIPDGLGALTRGDIEAYAAIATSAASWLEKQPFVVLHKASRDSPELQGTTVTVVTSEFLKAHPQIQAAWWAATQAGIAEIRRDQRAYLQFVSDATGFPVAVLEQTVKLDFAEQPIDPTGKASVQSTLEFLLGFGTAKAPFSVDDWVVNPG